MSSLELLLVNPGLNHISGPILSLLDIRSLCTLEQASKSVRHVLIRSSFYAKRLAVARKLNGFVECFTDAIEDADEALEEEEEDVDDAEIQHVKSKLMCLRLEVEVPRQWRRTEGRPKVNYFIRDKAVEHFTLTPRVRLFSLIFGEKQK